MRPVEERVDHDAARRRRRAVGRVEPIVVVEVVAEQRLAPVERALDRPRVRVEQQLGRVAAVAVGRVPRPVDAEAVSGVGAAGRGSSRATPNPSARAARPASSLPSSSKTHSSTASATSENTAMLVPTPSNVAPRGSGEPGQILVVTAPTVAQRAENRSFAGRHAGHQAGHQEGSRDLRRRGQHRGA